MKIAELENKTEEIILHARYLLIDNFSPERDYYAILKEHVAPKKWDNFIEEVTNDILNSRENYSKIYLATDIYVKEKQWDKLFEIIKKVNSINLLENYEDHLIAKFSSEVAATYEDLILKKLTRATDRSAYHECYRYLKKVKKLVDKEHFDNLIQQIKDLYPKRKALLDELSKI